MFAWLRSLMSAAAVVELHSKFIRVRDIPGRAVFEFEPLLSIDGAQRVVSIGRPISASAQKTYAPFANPAALAEEPHIAQLVLTFAYSKLGTAWVKPSPRVVISIGGDISNGARLMNDNSLVDLSAAAGARTTVIHRGRELSDVEAIRILEAA